METGTAAKALAALGHEGRLAAFRLILEAGSTGLPAGEVARRTGSLQNTSSSNLNVLASAGLIASRRDGRSIIYSVSYACFGELLEYLIQDFRGKQPDPLFAPFFENLLEVCRAGGPGSEHEVNANGEASP